MLEDFYLFISCAYIALATCHDARLSVPQRVNLNEGSKLQEAVTHHVPPSFLKLSSRARLVADGR